MAEKRAHFLLVGDGDDLPVIEATLLRLPVDAYGQVLVEVASELQMRPLDAPADMSVTWLRRDQTTCVATPVASRGELAARAAAAWITEWMPEEHAGTVPYVMWFGCLSSDRVERLYDELSRCVPHAHLHHAERG